MFLKIQHKHYALCYFSAFIIIIAAKASVSQQKKNLLGNDNFSHIELRSWVERGTGKARAELSHSSILMAENSFCFKENLTRSKRQANNFSF